LPAEQPQLRISVGGVPVPGVVSLEIESVGYFAADRFHAGFALAPAGIAYFASLGLQEITIEAALGGFGFTNLLTGQIDNVRIDMLRNIALLSGRDLSARLIDTEISETFANQTASQIAATLAARHQLSANVTNTTTPVGQYYELDHARSALGLHARATTEWNLLAALAQAEHFALSVTGTVLNFGPPPAATAVAVTPQNFVSLSLDMAANLPGQASVKSWNSRNKQVVAQTQGSGAQTTLIRPNLTPAQAQSMAANHLATVQAHGVMLTGVMPADVTLMPGQQLVLNGTGSSLDQSYNIASVSRTFQNHSGFLQNIRAYAVV
jgi:phage protein D